MAYTNQIRRSALASTAQVVQAMTVSRSVSSLLVHSSLSRLSSAQAHTTFCRPPLHAHVAMAMNQKVLITSVTPGISTSQLPSLTKVLGESHLSSFVLERWAQRHIQKRYAVAPVCPPEDDLKEQEWLLGVQASTCRTQGLGYQLRCRPFLTGAVPIHWARFAKWGKKLTGWKQGHTPTEFSEPLPLAGVLFWLFLQSFTKD